MHRIDGLDHVGNLFDEGDPGEPREATQITVDWLNSVQEEIANVITGAGISLAASGAADTARTQLRDAIRKMIAYPTKKVISGLDTVGQVINGSFSLLREGPDSGTARTGKATSANGADQYRVTGQFSLPKGAVITAVSVKVTHAGSGVTSASAWVKKIRPAASGSEFTVTDCLSASSLTLGGSPANGADHALAVHATAANRTVSQDDEVFAYEYAATGTGYNYFVALVVTYTVP